MSFLVETLTRLVAVDSTSSRSNGPIADLLESMLMPLGFSVRRQCWKDAAGVEKVNLVAQAGGDAPPALALVGHTDTVPFDPRWDEALALSSRDGLLFGRGACDTKGFIACAIDAVSRLEPVKLRAPLALVFTADEEVGCLGAKRLAEEKLLAPRFAIVGEPTSLRPIRAHKAYSVAEVKIGGHEAHSSNPRAGRSAILAAADLLLRIERLAAELEAETHPSFAPPHTTLNVGRISGGTAPNVVPGGCSVTLEWRSIPSQPVARVLDAVRALGAEIAAARGVELEVVQQRSDPSLDTPADAQLVRFLEEASNQACGTVAFGTEGPELAALGAEAVVFGPGDIAQAHKSGEYVLRAELERCSEILSAAFARFCG
jgi:acetylornithine deacetylase